MTRQKYYLVLMIILFVYVRKKLNEIKKLKARVLRKIKDTTRQKYHEGYPNTWYYLTNVPECGSQKRYFLCDRQIMVVRDEEGEINAFHPFCPHLGTNLIHGEVKGSCITCPYHGWKFDVSTGDCVDIPYNKEACGKHKKMNLKKYDICIFEDMVFVWYHKNCEPPTFTLDNIFDGLHNKMRPTQFGEEWNMNIMEPSQNSADSMHFNYVHTSIPNTFGIYTLNHNVTTEFNNKPGEKHMITATETVYNHKLLGYTLPDWITKHSKPTSTVTAYGPSIMTFRIDFGYMHTTHLFCFVPQEKYSTNHYITTFHSSSMSKFLAWIFEKSAEGIINQDRIFWEERDNSIMTVKNDDPFVEYRAWYKQFFKSNLEW